MANGEGLTMDQYDRARMCYGCGKLAKWEEYNECGSCRYLGQLARNWRPNKQGETMFVFNGPGYREVRTVTGMTSERVTAVWSNYYDAREMTSSAVETRRLERGMKRVKAIAHRMSDSGRN